MTKIFCLSPRLSICPFLGGSGVVKLPPPFTPILLLFCFLFGWPIPPSLWVSRSLSLFRRRLLFAHYNNSNYLEGNSLQHRRRRKRRNIRRLYDKEKANLSFLFSYSLANFRPYFGALKAKLSSSKNAQGGRRGKGCCFGIQPRAREEEE